MTNAQLNALRTLAHQLHDGGAREVLTVDMRGDQFEVRRGGRVLGRTYTWAAAHELAAVDEAREAAYVPPVLRSA